MVAAMMVLQGKWSGEGVFNVEQLDPEPFLKALSKNGLSFKVVDHKPLPANLGLTK